MLKKIFLFLTMLIQVTAGLSAEEGEVKKPLIISAHPDRPPFSYVSDETLTGIMPDIVGLILKKMGVYYESRFIGPWKRVQEFARRGKVDLIAGLYHKKKREKYLFFSEYVCEDSISAFVTWKKAFFITSRKDLRSLRGVTLFGDSFGDNLDGFIENELKMIRVYSAEEMVEHLLSQKADYMIFSHYSGLIDTGQMGVGDKIIPVGHELGAEKIYIAVSKKSPYTDLLPAINREIRRLRRNGQLDVMIKKRIHHYLLKIE